MKEQIYIRLKNIREQKGFSQAEVANHLHISRQAISNWENGKSFPDIDNIVILSELYNISVDELLGVKEPVSKENDYKSHKVPQDNITKKDSDMLDKSMFEILSLSVILVLSAQFPFIGVIASLIILVWIKRMKRTYKIMYLVCAICILVSLYTTHTMIAHLLIDMSVYDIQKVGDMSLFLINN